MDIKISVSKLFCSSKYDSSMKWSPLTEFSMYVFFNISLHFVVDADWVAGSSPFTKVEATGDTESTGSRSEDGGDDGVEVTEFYTYDRLKSSSTDPAPKINIKRKEVYLIQSSFLQLVG